MNLFVWNHLKDRKRLSYVLRRPYKEILEPATLKGWKEGVKTSSMLFLGLPESETEGAIAEEITAYDLDILDMYHAVERGIHKRLTRNVEIVRFGKKVSIKAHVYVNGPDWGLIQGRSLE